MKIIELKNQDCTFYQGFLQRKTTKGVKAFREEFS